MLQICPKLPNQQFEEPPFEEAILTFLRDLGHSGEIKKLNKIKLATKRCLIQTHRSHASIFGANEGTGGKPGVPNVPTYGSSDEKISWKSSEEDDDDDDDNDDDDDDADNQDDNGQEDDGQDNESQDDDNEQTDLDNDGDDFVHPKFSTHDQDERNHEEDSFDPTVQTPSHLESTNDEDSDEEIQGVNVEGDELDEEETNEEDEGYELYRDMTVNQEGRDIEMTDAQQTNFQTTQVIEDTHVIITLVNPEGQHQSYSMSAASFLTCITLVQIQGSKRRRARKEPESTSAPKEKTFKITSKSTEGSKSHHKSVGESAQTEDAKDLEKHAHQEFKIGMEDPHESFNELMDTPLDFLAFVMNRLKVDTLTLELLAGVESYQKKLNLTKPDTYKSDLKRRDTYTAYFNPRGFIYQNKDKKNRLMRIDELQKFSDGTLNDVWTAINDHICHRLSGDKVIKIKQEL
nr:hypothetical protein [Tanacetum cinerariifolium]